MIHQKLLVTPILTLGGTRLRSNAQPRKSFENCSNDTNGLQMASEVGFYFGPNLKVSLLVKK